MTIISDAIVVAGEGQGSHWLLQYRVSPVADVVQSLCSDEVAWMAVTAHRETCVMVVI